MRFFSGEAIAFVVPPLRFKAAVDGYQEPHSVLRPELSPALQTLAETDLHDGLFRQVVIDHAASALTLKLRCSCLQTAEGVPVGYFDLDLRYQRVVLTSEGLAILRQVGAERGSEILYSELDRTPDGSYEHRLLSIAGNAYRVVAPRFRDLLLERTPREKRWGKRGWPRRSLLEIP